ncbi:hypothetical protein A9Q73_07385 [Bermanella sp. 47_1433_sub80_T6]|nr:hypothetical protein A9Q73_07385 [Bermanella sp. 47_1433_sub80_T6]
MMSKLTAPVVTGLTLTAALMTAVSSHAEIAIDAQLDYEISAYFNDRATSFLNSSIVDQRINNSVSLELELFTAWDNDDQTITFKPFFRQDEMDDERTHGDIRELMWNKLSDDYELKLGVGKVFWGVTESAHLVDIINQTDSVESIDGEQKLGQPMVQVLLEREWGNLDLFVLPYFRERTFAGSQARLSAGLDYAAADYESSSAEQNIDFAMRFNSYIDDFEYALSAFHGTSREAVVGFDYKAVDGVLVADQFRSYYPIISQIGVEVQYLNEGWAWKFEGIVRDGVPVSYYVNSTELLTWILQSEVIEELTGEKMPVPETMEISKGENYFATAAGFEYTQVGIWETRIDLGWVVEHIYDSRQEKASPGAFEHDVLLATRWAANDDADSTLLAGVVYDYEYEDYSVSIEGNTRLFDGLSLAVEARVFAPANDSPQIAFRDEDFVKLTLSYYL